MELERQEGGRRWNLKDLEQEWKKTERRQTGGKEERSRQKWRMCGGVAVAVEWKEAVEEGE